MAYTIQNTRIGYPVITDTDTVQKVALGTIVEAYDPVYGAGEFIYLKGVASTVLGSVVNYNADDWTTALLATNGIGPCAVAMSANVANQYGWYQISGKAIVKAATVVDNAAVWATATGGQVDDATNDGYMVHLAKFASADGTPSAGLAECEIHRPYTDGIATND
ncbi:MAG TPA: hypothetical protein VFA39_15645 [Steroidobacteraceae bacterium]|nr:hypothetical protein [Steroidobacteraceae bacterium]